MENRAYAFIAGLFALLLCAGLIAAFWWLGGSHKDENEYLVVSAYPVVGLSPQATVRYRGVGVGRVQDIEIDAADNRLILIHIAIDSRLQLTRGSYAKLVPQGLTGLSSIELDDAGKDPRPLGTQKIPLQQSDMSQLMHSGKELISKTSHLLDTTQRLLNSFDRLLAHGNMQKIERLVDNIERASDQLDPLLQSTHATSEKAGKLLAEIRPQELSATLEAVRNASSSLQQTSEQARPAMLKFREALDEFERIGRRIEQSSATLSNTIGTQTLPQTHQLLEQLQRDAETLNRLMESLEQNPQSMVFGKPRPAPGPGEKGYQP